MIRSPNPHPHARRARLAALIAPALLAVAAFTGAGAGPAMAQEGARAPAEDPKVARLEAKADDLVERGQIFEAIKTLDSAVEIAPSRFDLRLKLAGLEKKRGMWLRSAAQYRAILDAEPTHVEARLGYGELLLADYQFEAAVKEFRALIAQHPPHRENDRALVGLGTSLYGMEEYKEAGDVFDILLKDHPENPTAHAYKNLVLRKLGDLDGAVDGWKRFLELKPGVGRAEALKAEAETLRASIVRQTQAVAENPGNARAHQVLGDYLVEKPDPAGALAEFRKAAKLAPEDPEILIRYATSLRDSGGCKEAFEPLEALAKLTLYRAVAGYNLAFCGKAAGKPDKEIEGWTAVLQINHEDRFAYRKYLDALERGGKLKQEAKILSKATSDRPGDPVPWLQYAMLARAMGDDKEALRSVLDALTLEPNDPEPNRELSSILFERPGLSEAMMSEIAASAGDAGAKETAFRQYALNSVWGESKKAMGVLESFVKEQPDDAQALVALAHARRSAGQGEEDWLPLLERARDLQPDYFYARLQLAVALESLGRSSAAAEEARKALDLRPDNPYASTILGAALRGKGDPDSLKQAHAALERAILMDPMDSTGAARFLLAKVAWQLGYDAEARRTLHGDLPVDPEDMYAIAWEFLRSSYRDRGFNDQDWNSWRDRYEGTLKTRADALGAISLMLASLDDRDTRLRAYDQTANLFFTTRSVDVERDPEGRAELSSKTVATATLPENVGYLAVSNMTDPKLVKEVEGAVTKMESRDGVILDLRGNQGGAEDEVQQVTSMLVPKGTPTGTVVTPEKTTKREVPGEKPPILPKDKPIVVLVDENTASSAELLASSLKESKRAVVVGQRTYGKAGIQVPHLLPDGTTLLVAVAESGDLQGHSYAGEGIQPDVEIPNAEASDDPTSDPAVLKAREILRLRKAKDRGDTWKQEQLEPNKSE